MAKRRPRHTGFVRTRGSSHQLVFRVGGKQYVRTVHTDTLKAAQAMLPAWIASVQSGAVDAAKAAKLKTSQAPTFSEAAAAFIQRETVERTSKRKAYEYALRRVGKVLGDTKVSVINGRMVRDCFQAIHSEGAIAVTKLVHVVVGQLFRSLVEAGTIDKSPVTTFTKLKLIGQAGKETLHREALSSGQVAALIEASTGDLRLFVEVMAATGVRPGEALALTWNSVDFAKGEIRVTQAVKVGGDARGQGRLGTTKTSSSRRTLPLGPALAATLLSALDARQADYRKVSLPAVEGDDCIFCADIVDTRKVPQVPGLMLRCFHRAAATVGLPKVTPHYLRHTYATTLVANGVDVFSVARLLGHKDATMVLKVYGHAGNNLAKAASFADALLPSRVRGEQTANVISLRGA